MLRCFTPGGCLGFPQADCEVQLNSAAIEQPNGKKSDDFNGEAYCRDATPKRDQAKPAAQLPLHKLPPAPHDTLYPHILQHGRGILSLSTLQQGLQHFVIPDVGYIAYTMMRNGPDVFNVLSPLALGDPICDPVNFALMAQAFLQQHPKAIFMQVSAEFAAVLQSCGLLVNSMGGETVLDLASYSFSGYAKRGLRSAIASAAKGVAVEEVMQAAPMLQAAGKGAAAAAAVGGADWARLASEMREVDRLWLSRKGKHAGNFWFINRPPVFAPEPGVRKFTARDSSSGQLLGFIFFDAVFEPGQVVGYYANVTRMVPDAHPGVLNLLVSNFMDRVREESQLAAPEKKQSMRRSLRRKLEQQAAAAAAAAGLAPTDSTEPAAPTAPSSSSSSSSSSVRFLSLGLSPLYQMDDSRFEHSSKIRSIFEAAFERGAAFYPFKSLAAAKAKYGAGLHDGRFEDPSVTYQQTYMAHSCRGAAGAVAMFDVAKTVGLWRHPADAAGIFLQHKLKQGLRKAKAKLPNKQQQHGSGASSSSSSRGVAPAGKAAAVAAAAAAAGPKPAAAAPAKAGKAPAAAAAAAAAGGKAAPLLLVSMSSTVSDNASLIGTAAAAASAAAGSSQGSEASLRGSSRGCSAPGSSRSACSAAAGSEAGSIDSFYSSCAADGCGSE